MKRYTIILFASFLVLLSAFHAPAADEELERVRNLYKSMNRVPKGKEVFYMRFSIASTLRDAPPKADRVSRSEAEMLVSETQSRYLSREAEVYMDNKDAFTLLPARKMLYWSDSNRKDGREKRMAQVPVLHDSLFARCRVAESKNVNESGADRCVTLVPKKGETIFGVSRYRFYYNSRTNTLKKMVSEYPASHRFEKVEIEYEKFDFNYSAPVMFKPVKPVFISNRGKLQNAYQEYTLVDNRKKN